MPPVITVTFSAIEQNLPISRSTTFPLNSLTQIIDAVSIITYGDHSLSDQPAYPVFTLILQQFVQPSGEPSFHGVKSSLIKKSVLSDFQANSPEQKNCLYSPDSYLRSEIVVHDVLSRYAQLIEHLVDRHIHHRRPAKIVFDIFRRFMVFEVVFKYDFVDKAHIAAPIGPLPSGRKARYGNGSSGTAFRSLRNRIRRKSRVSSALRTNT